MIVDYKIKTVTDGSTKSYVVWHVPALRFVDFKSKRVLDIGCGAGGFLNYLRNRYQSKVHGIDPNSSNAEKCKESGIKVLVGYAEEFMEQFEKEFDVVTSFEVLEHVYSYKDLFAPAHYFLRENCPFVISTPNAFHVLRIWSMFWGEHRDMLMDPTRYDRPEHIRLYSYKMMKRAFEKSGFSDIKVYGVLKLFNREIVLKNKYLINYFAQHVVGVGYKKGRSAHVLQTDAKKH
jgi:2-polyprenyl-3-methyl-5-hydroxy-6-metoxy-1,4-benzoquinol methylase